MRAGAAAVEVTDLVVKYGHMVVLPSLSLAVEEGEFLSLLGPSGCGKTTTLNAIAGFADIASGSVRIAGRNVTNLPPQARNLGMVFQRYALFPHMTVANNVAYGLKLRSVPKAEIEQRVNKILSTVRLEGMQARYPSQLSGGQQQRVALSRALVIEPNVLLLDEPLSNLDANLRREMQVEIKRIHQELGITSIYVTHDQEEALSMSDRIAIMNAGRIEQLGTPKEVYRRPVSSFVSRFIGEANLCTGMLSTTGDLPMGSTATVILPSGATLKAMGTGSPAASGRVQVSVRQEAITLLPATPAGDRDGRWVGTVAMVNFVGPMLHYVVNTTEGTVNARMPAQTADDSVTVGTDVELRVDPIDVVLLPPESA